jgi:xanthine dehydrogenase YagS FAD-binding subunit
VKPFGYQAPSGPAAAVALVAGRPGAAFLAGGTNLIDLMKLGVAAPDLLVDVTGLLPDVIEHTAEGGDGGQGRGLRIGAGVRNSCGTRPPSAATCSSAPAARTSRT